VTLSRLLLALGLLFFGAGCAFLDDYSTETYYRVLVTDPRGHLIADWIAKGHVHRIETGYRFRAVERLTAPPWPKLIRYPRGRIVEASGPNITVTRCAKPLWLETVYHEHVVVHDRSKD
jgi:hypothetical protein